MEVRHLLVSRTARYVAAGHIGSGVRELWFVLHGYGQLATDFMEPFAALAGAERLIVAPEALSRFYVSRGSGRIGATWMTSEDRESEIKDYVGYLDRLYDEVREDVGQAEVHVLGFSQGCETAARWMALGAVEPVSLTLWGGFLPPDLDLRAHRSAFARCSLRLVSGAEDEWATPARLDELETRLAEHDLPVSRREFAGGHAIDPVVLREIVVDVS